MEEIWKDIKEYEGLYQVSSMGNIRSIKRRKTKGGLIKQNCKNEYKYVTLSKYGKLKNFRVHRLVTEAFIENPNNYDIVNHKDENKINNCVNNLEWCTQAQNVHHSRKTASIIQLSTDNKIIQEWESALKAKIEKGFDDSAIIRCCRGKARTHKGYKWKYKNMS